jgi:hypothetical protein
LRKERRDGVAWILQLTVGSGHCMMDLKVMDLKVEIGPLFLLGYLPG